MIMIYVTCRDENEAERISRHLLKERLVACANIWPIRSLYSWKGKLEDSREFVMLVKSVKANAAKITGEIKKMHSYEIPCIQIMESRTNKEYGQWAKGEMA